MAGLPRHTAKLALGWRHSDALSFGLDAQAQSGLVVQGNEDGAGTWRVAGHGVVNAQARWQALQGWEVSAALNNLTGQRYASYAALGRDMFPRGQALNAGAAPALARFVAPAAGRSLVLALRYRY
jgi:outer membrane receptor protein involved in Fe transport